MGAFRSSRMDDFEIVAAPDPSRRASRVAVVGGGASGTLMALALARQRPDIDVTLIEPGQIGAGLAYGTSHGEHRLNVLPQRLSPFSDQPDDFAHWLVARGQIAEVGEKAFVPRALMGAYLSERLATLGRRVSIRHASVTTIDADAELIHVRLHSGEIVAADAVILATGHSWAPPRDLDRDVPPDASVTILGTGLGMVDRWLSLRESGHRGPVVAVSRHGLAPLSHGACPTPLSLPAVPLGWSVSQTMCWLRDLAAQVADWRMAVDAIRPHTQRIWQSWTQSERRRFLRHARRYWDVHRHRIAPDIALRLAQELEERSVRLVRAHETTAGDYLFDCRGHLPDWSDLSNPLIASLVRDGLIRPDALGIGLDVTPGCNLVARDGQPWPQMFAVGPITRGRFWEIEAIPDIRVQCEALAQSISLGAGVAAV